MPFGNNSAEDFVLGQTTAFGSGVAKEYKKSTQKKRQRDLMNYMERMGMQNQIADASNQRLTYDPNSPLSEKQIVKMPNKGFHSTTSKYVLRDKQDPLNRDWNTLKDTATFAAKDPKTFSDVVRLSLLQSPVKAVGRLGEATWARGNDNYQNDLSKQFYDSYMKADTENWQTEKDRDDPTTAMGKPLGDAKTGSYDDMMKRLEAFMMHKEILGSMEPDFTSDTTFGDFADVASWLIPGPGIIGKGVKGAVKGGAAVGKGVKDMRTALAAAKASGFADDVSRGTRMGLGMVGGLGTGGVGGVPLGTVKAVNRMRASGIPNNPRGAANAAIAQLSDASKGKNSDRLQIEQEDFYNQFGRDENNWGTVEKDTHEYLQSAINEETVLHRDQFAANVETAQRAIENGTPIEDALKQIGVDSKMPNAWMLKFIDADSVRAGESVADYLETFTHDLQQLKQKAMRTLKEGQDRQIEKQKKNPKIKIDKLPYQSADDIPDEVIDRLLKHYGEGIPTGTRDTRTGKSVNALSIAFDHINSLGQLGANSDDNFQILLGILNSIKSGS